MSRPPQTVGATDRIDRCVALGANGLGGLNANVAVDDTNNATFIFTGSAAEDEWTDAAHGYLTGLLIQFSAVGTGAPEFLITTDYWVIRLGANTFKLASSLANALAGTPIEGTVNSTGTWTVEVQAQTFRAGPPAGEVWDIARMLVRLEDGSAAFNADNYGAVSALSNGTQVQVGQADGTVLHYLTGEAEDGTAQQTIQSNLDWYALFFDEKEATFGSGNDALIGRWSYFKSNPANHGLLLDGDRGDEFQVVINDDLAGLVKHTFRLEGVKVR